MDDVLRLIVVAPLPRAGNSRTYLDRVEGEPDGLIPISWRRIEHRHVGVAPAQPTCISERHRKKGPAGGVTLWSRQRNGDQEQGDCCEKL